MNILNNVITDPTKQLLFTSSVRDQILVFVGQCNTIFFICKAQVCTFVPSILILMVPQPFQKESDTIVVER